MDCSRGITSSICLIVTILKLFLSLYLKALHFRKYTTASDVWSYGAVMYEIWSLGHNPFKSYTNQEVNFNSQSYEQKLVALIVHERQ